jgi:hypothetical protein
MDAVLVASKPKAGKGHFGSRQSCCNFGYFSRLSLLLSSHTTKPRQPPGKGGTDGRRKAGLWQQPVLSKAQNVEPKTQGYFSVTCCCLQQPLQQPKRIARWHCEEHSSGVPDLIMPFHEEAMCARMSLGSRYRSLKEQRSH